MSRYIAIAHRNKDIKVEMVILKFPSFCALANSYDGMEFCNFGWTGAERTQQKTKSTESIKYFYFRI